MKSIVVNVLAAITGFAAVAIPGFHAVPWPESFTVSVKIEHLHEHPAAYDALFVGSSNVYRSYVPRVIDARLAELGHPLRSFNLGGPSMWSFESDFVLRRALSIPGLQLDYVLIEPGDWDAIPKTPEEVRNMLSNRSVFWHDLRQTWNVVCALACSRADITERLSLGRSHLHAFAWRMCSYGQGPRILGRLRGEVESQPISAADLEREHGYLPLEDLRTPEAAKRRKLLTDDLPGYEQKIRDMQRRNREPLDPGAFCWTATERQMAFIRQSGATPVHVVPPTGIVMNAARALHERGVIDVIAFNDPDAHPTYYLPRSRFDPNHLSRDSAETFSREFAEALAESLSANQGL